MLHIIEECGMLVVEMLGGALVLGAIAAAVALISQYGATILETLL